MPNPTPPPDELLDWLFSAECSQLLATYAAADPVRLALQVRARLGPRAAWLATQVHLRQKHALRLADLLSADTRLLPQAAEQATHEAAAKLRWQHLPAGRLALDLTAGLGTDTRALAQRFQQVIAVEANPQLAELLRRNHARLGLANVVVLDATAEAFATQAPPADFLFLDPDRRPTPGNRGVALADIQPDLPTLLPRLRQLAPQVQVKLSPLFDLAAGFSQLPDVAEAWALSLDGEVKEVGLGWTEPAPHEPRVRAVGQKQHLHLAVSVDWAAWNHPPPLPLPEGLPAPGTYVLLPDAALAKARLIRHLEPLLPPGSVCTSPSGIWLCPQVPDTYLGRIFQLVQVRPYQPKAWRTWFREQGIQEANLATRDVARSTADLRRELGLREGGLDLFLVTLLPGQSRSGWWMLHLQPLP